MNAAPEAATPLEPVVTTSNRFDALAGVLIGTAVGDSIGLQMEGLSRRRQRRLFSGPLQHHFFAGFGMISDDTEHTLLVAQSSLECPNDVAQFQQRLALKLKWWLVSLPAGVGFATLRAIIKLWIGFPPNRSGVMSAGNGPAMRSALFGVYFAENPKLRKAFSDASTLVTHRDPRAAVAALAVVETAAWMTKADTDTGVEVLFGELESLDPGSEWRSIIKKLRTGYSRTQAVSEFAADVGAIDGVSGYAFQTVPVAIFAALRYPEDFHSALTEVVACGGDTDTVGAITGALVGARVGLAGIPDTWQSRLIDWPRSIGLLLRISERLNQQITTSSILGSVRYFWPVIPLRNLFFLAIVIGHGFRRLLPPY
jgi:ADP-ribosyl-[dinitrogen reductase] hydrolase